MQSSPSGWRPSFRVGLNLVCRVIGRQEGGYAVQLEGSDAVGILQTTENLLPGQEVLAQVVVAERRRLLLRPHCVEADLETSLRRKASSESGSWRFQLAARCRRTSDLIPQTMPGDELEVKDIEDVTSLLCQLEGGMRTACLKGTCSDCQSRFVLLVLKGRLVGCTYGRKGQDLGNLPSEEAARLVIEDLHNHTVKLAVYDIEEELMMPLSALYGGESIQQSQEPLAAFESLKRHFTDRGLTGTLVLTAPSESDSCPAPLSFAYIHNGQIAGVFEVLEQRFVNSIEPLVGQARSVPGAVMQASILTDAGCRVLGTSLSMVARGLPVF